MKISRDREEKLCGLDRLPPIPPKQEREKPKKKHSPATPAPRTGNMGPTRRPNLRVPRVFPSSGEPA